MGGVGGLIWFPPSLPIPLSLARSLSSERGVCKAASHTKNLSTAGLLDARRASVRLGATLVRADGAKEVPPASATRLLVGNQRGAVHCIRKDTGGQIQRVAWCASPQRRAGGWGRAA